jgi:hypothetical protein
VPPHEGTVPSLLEAGAEAGMAEPARVAHPDGGDVVGAGLIFATPEAGIDASRARLLCAFSCAKREVCELHCPELAASAATPADPAKAAVLPAS